MGATIYNTLELNKIQTYRASLRLFHKARCDSLHFNIIYKMKNIAYMVAGIGMSFVGVFMGHAIISSIFGSRRSHAPVQ